MLCIVEAERERQRAEQCEPGEWGRGRLMRAPECRAAACAARIQVLLVC